MNPLNRMEKVQNGIASPIVSGLVVSVLVMLAGVLVVSLVLAWSVMPEDSLPMSVTIIHGIALLAGGLTTGRKKGMKGWYYGSLLGIIYWVMIVLIGFLSMNAPFDRDMLIAGAACFVTGAVGGIIGVNLTSKRR